MLCFKYFVLFLLLFASHGLAFAELEHIDNYTLKGEKHFLTGYEPGDPDTYVNVVVEIPKGTTGKWEIDPESGYIIWEFKNGKPRTVDYMGGYVANYGAIPKTALPEKFGGDGESIDVVIIGDAIERGEVVEAKIIGILNLYEDKVYDGKILAVRKGSPEESVSTIDELNSQFDNVVDKVAKWFVAYKGPGSGLTYRGIGPAKEAAMRVTVSIKAFKK